MNEFMKAAVMAFVIIGSCLGYWCAIERIINKIQIKQMKKYLKKAMEAASYDINDVTTDKQVVENEDCSKEIDYE